MTEAHARVERALDQVFSSVAPPRPFEVGAFCRDLGQARGHPIELMPLSQVLGGRVAPFDGLLVSAFDADYVFYDDTTSALHQQNTILHEIGHLVLEHRSIGDSGQPRLPMLRLLFPHFNEARREELLGKALCRAGFQDIQEREAESFATQFSARLLDAEGGRVLGRRAKRLPPHEAQVIDRLAQGLGPGQQ
ncbi:ImmA/IrrE family metallo-endopeptidase [Crossiella sp. CA-258035]|uniref:ImmA/IrrE family metallo-endopeptidase n=1 Tax=Crossiella sp. CA-258035 TaxID=2981138 RepID=UPI0024BC43F0|nr:ImmA/IrrE family metallo-endopeptidase [Crossiella sp. CA-258035]WHT20804.1 ImmA/IrrE family metallo-endopeptidase [Crossiella sp. CA-258035]